MTDFGPWLTQTDKNSFAFNYDFEGKALEQPDGDLILEGYAVEWNGEDRESEFFVPGALKNAAQKFLGRSSHPLCFHHKKEKVLGSVLSLEEDERGLKLRARVDGAVKQHPELGVYYEQIRKGTLGNLSVGGKFYRRIMPGGKAMIHDMDLVEISVTAAPVDERPSFAVIAGKALEDAPAEVVPMVPASWVESLDVFRRALEGKAEVAQPKGDYTDRQALALIIAFEQLTENMPEHTSADDPDGDARVDNLIGEMKTALDGYAKQAHALAAKLGPLPKVNWEHHVY